MKRLCRNTTEDVCKQLCVWFLDIGWLCAIRTDGELQFHEPFVEFCCAKNVEHELSSVYNHESNGLAKAGMHRPKELLEKCRLTGEEIDVALHEYLGTPSAGSELHLRFCFLAEFLDDCCLMCMLSSPVRMLCHPVKGTCLQRNLSRCQIFKLAIDAHQSLEFGREDRRPPGGWPVICGAH